MTQPVEFTTEDPCSGRWPAPRETPPPITAPEPGTYVLNHQPGHIELWQVNDDGNPIELTDAALWE